MGTANTKNSRSGGPIINPSNIHGIGHRNRVAQGYAANHGFISRDCFCICLLFWDRFIDFRRRLAEQTITFQTIQHLLGYDFSFLKIGTAAIPRLISLNRYKIIRQYNSNSIAIWHSIFSHLTTLHLGSLYAGVLGLTIYIVQ